MTATKERPIIFSGPMVRALLSGTKTQTRRVIQPTSCGAHARSFPKLNLRPAPFQVGQFLWVRETWKSGDSGLIYYRADDHIDFPGWPWRSPIHMPRWASRITLEILSVRVERLQAITEDDAKAEGCEIGHGLGGTHFFAREEFQTLWDSLNAKRGHGFDLNPWLWRIEFRRLPA